MLIRLMPGCLTIALLAIGCAPATTPEFEQEVSSGSKTPTQTQKTPPPPKVAGGAIRGRVVDNAGTPVGGAEVRVAGAKSLSANPIASDAAAEIDNGRTMSVMHDFGDGQGEVLAERRPRLSLTKIEKYIYLRPGEFFIEGLSAGKVTVNGAFLSAVAAPVTVTVAKDKTTSDVKLVLPIGGAAAPSASPSAAPATPSAAVEWTGLTPATGMTVRVQASGNVYTPADAVVKVGLKAAAGVQVAGYTVVYQWSENGTPKQSAPEQMPMLPRSLTAGAEVALDVALSVGQLAEIYKAGTLGTVTASVQFLDEGGAALKGKNGQALSVGIPIRRL